jgi:hypothetical protein
MAVHASLIVVKHVVHENLIGGIIWVFPLVIADSERGMPGFKPWAPRLVHPRSDHLATRIEKFVVSNCAELTF